MHYNQSRKRLYLLLLLSLCMHGILMLIIFVIKHPERNLLMQLMQQQVPLTQPTAIPAQQQQQPVQQEPESDVIPFMLNLKEDSQFGATVIFQDEPELAGENGELNLDIQPQAQTQELPDVSETEQTIEDTVEESPDVQPTQELPTPQAQPEQHEASASDNLGQTQAEQPVIKKKRKKKKKTFLAGSGLKNAAPITHNMTLAKLAEGFLNYSHNRSNESIDINTKDFKYTGYMQKVGWYLQNSFHLNNKSLNLPFDIRTHVTLFLEIKEDGSLIDSQLTPSTGFSKLDENFLKIARGAAPFPPMPKHFGKSSLKISMPISVNLPQGTGTYYFIFKGA